MEQIEVGPRCINIRPPTPKGAPSMHPQSTTIHPMPGAQLPADVRTIPLTQGCVALVDAADYEWLSQWKWCVLVRPHANYALRSSARVGGKQTVIKMHRLILGTAPGLDTDHINGDGLDNRRANLRECSRGENSCNRRSPLGTSSSFLGVSWHKQKQKWRAQIQVNGAHLHIGYFHVEAEAAEAYKAAAALAFGEFAAGARGDRAN